MKKVLLLLAMFPCIALFAYTTPANSDLRIGRVASMVMDKASRQPITYAAIVIKTQDRSSDKTGRIIQADGTFKVKDLPEGDLLFEVQFIGYKTHSQLMKISKKDRKLNLGVIALEEQA